MTSERQEVLRGQLLERRQRLEAAVPGMPDQSQLVRLLDEVDAALGRMEQGTYGICETCHEPVEEGRLLADPLARVCLDHLTASEQRALEQDLHLAAQIQGRLLPPKTLRDAGWEACYHYEPAGPVSGDYCDMLKLEDNSGWLFLLGDVSGKGVAASMLMSHLHAMFRSLSGPGVALAQLLERANRLFCDSTLTSHYATLVAVQAHSSGEVEIANAGHCPALLIRGGEAAPVAPTGLPIGLFCEGKYGVERIRLSPGDGLLLYSDGLAEARGPGAAEYGMERLCRVAGNHTAAAPVALLGACLADLDAFRAGLPLKDDLTALVIRRT